MYVYIDNIVQMNMFSFTTPISTSMSAQSLAVVRALKLLSEMISAKENEQNDISYAYTIRIFQIYT